MDKDFLKELLRRVSTVIYPNRCPYCGEVIDVNSFVCSDCLNGISQIPDSDICLKCGQQNIICSCNLDENQHFNAIIAPFYYEDAILKLIHRFKFQGYDYLAEMLTPSMLSKINYLYKNISFDYIAYVPLTPESLKQRGYNQSFLLAKDLSKKLNIQLLKDGLIKTKAVSPQHELSAAERKTNITGAFAVNDKFDFTGTIILLVDDIKTTGSTLNECSRILKAAGAKEIYCVTAAITRIDKGF